jgi:hypothetical protein
VYAAVPLSLGCGPILQLPDIRTPLYIVAALGFVAVLRGATVTPFIQAVGYACLGYYAIVLAFDMLHGGPFHLALLYDANILSADFIVLALPFLAIGFREVDPDKRILEWTIAASIAIVTVVSVYQHVVLGQPRPSAFSLNSIHFGLTCWTWSLYLLARALSDGAVRWSRLAAALVGLVPMALSGSKLVWVLAFVGYGGLFAAWVWRGSHWRIFLAVVAAMVPAAWILSYAQFARQRLDQLSLDLGAFLATGSTSGPTFGLRYAAAVGGFRAFLDRPLLGYGMLHVKLAATDHQSPQTGAFGSLYHLHNEYITFMVAYGIIGLLLLIVLIAGFVVASMRAGDRALKHFGLAFIGGLAVFMAADRISSNPLVRGLVFFILGLLLMAEAPTAKIAEPARPPRPVPQAEPA